MATGTFANSSLRAKTLTTLLKNVQKNVQLPSFFSVKDHKLHQVLQQNLRSRTIEICLLFVYTQRAEQVTLFCRQQVEYSDDDEPKPSVHLSQAQKLRKVIIELVDTERSYVKVNKTDVAALSLRWAFCVGHCRDGEGVIIHNQNKNLTYLTKQLKSSLT